MYVMQHVSCIIHTSITHMLTHDIGTPIEYVNCLVDMLNIVMVHLHAHPHLTSKHDKYGRLCDMYSEHVMKDMDYPMRDKVTGAFPFKLRTCHLLRPACPMAGVDIAEVSVHYIVSVLCPLFINIVHYPISTTELLKRSKRWSMTLRKQWRQL
jgi:hypothetical protein